MGRLQDALARRMGRADGDKILDRVMARIADDGAQRAHEDEARLPNELPYDEESLRLQRVLLRLTEQAVRRESKKVGGVWWKK